MGCSSDAAMTVYDLYADQWGDMVDVIAEAKAK